MNWDIPKILLKKCYILGKTNRGLTAIIRTRDFIKASCSMFISWWKFYVINNEKYLNNYQLTWAEGCYDKNASKICSSLKIEMKPVEINYILSFWVGFLCPLSNRSLPCVRRSMGIKNEHINPLRKSCLYLIRSIWRGRLS